MQLFVDFHKLEVFCQKKSQKSQTTTYRREPPDKPLTDIENKLLDLTEKFVISEIPSIPELGLIVELVGLGTEDIPVIAGTYKVNVGVIIYGTL